jgi:hypothetical protein
MQRLPACLVGIEACPRRWSRELWLGAPS